MIIMQSLIEEKIAAVEQRKDDAKRLNKRFTMEMNVHMAHMFQVATEQAALPAEQRTATPQSICQALGVELGKFETKPYIEAMKSEIEISYPTEITNIIRARRAAARNQSGSSSCLTEQQSITPEPALRPNVGTSAQAALESEPAQPKETTSNNMALGN